MELGRGYEIDKDNVTHRIIDQEAVILNLDNGYYYSLNEVGTIIWESINRKMSLSEILCFLEEKYHLPKENLKKDLLELVKDLEKEKLIIEIKKASN